MGLKRIWPKSWVSMDWGVDLRGIEREELR